MMDQLLTEQQLAELLGKSPKTLERDRMSGVGIPFIRVGRSIRYRTSDVEKYLDERTVAVRPHE